MLTMDHFGKLAAIRQIANLPTAELARILPGCAPEVADGVRAHVEKRTPASKLPALRRTLGLADPRRETGSMNPILDRYFDSCQAVIDELDHREAEASVTGASLADLVAVVDPSSAHVVLMTRADYTATYTRPAERAFVADADPPDALRVVMLDGQGSGRSLLLSDFKRALALLTRGQHARGRRYV